MGNALNPFGAKGRQHGAEKRESDAAQQMQDISNQLFAQTGGLRGSTVSTLEQVMAGGRPSQMRVFAPEREAIEQQFRRVRENILSTTPMRGGQLNRSLADVEIARAMGVSGLESDVRRSAFANALGIGFGVPPITLAGLGGAGQIFGTAANRALQETQQKNQSIGMLAGVAVGAAGIGGAGASMCWVAAALYGRQSEEFQLARLWIVELWDGRTATLARWAYRRWGRRVAASPIARVLLRPLFDRAVLNARTALAEI